MDSFFPLSNPGNHLEIALFGNEIYDNLGFYSYPLRRNWEPRNHSLTGDYQPHTSIDAASFVQAWLFFGTISEVTGIPVRGTSFLRVSESDGEQRLVVTTKSLQFYIDTWGVNTTSVRKVSVRFTVHTLLVPEHPEVAVSIELLLVVLVDAFKDTYGAEAWNILSVYTTDVEDRELAPGVNQRVATYLKTRMVAQGWCPQRLASLGELPRSDALYTLSLMGTRELLSGHERCDEHNCMGNYVDDATYNQTARHVTGGCDCGFVMVDVEKVVRITENGQIPIAMVVQDLESKQVRLETIPYQAGITYIAISHVWAHGLGNPDENALRSCQLLELDKLVKATLEDQDLRHGDTETAYFWIDTLCLPLRPQHSRNTGIKQMRHCYEAATAVLVLDNHLRRSTALNPSIAIEALLQKLILQFIDTSVDAEELLLFCFTSHSQGLTSEAERFQNLSMFLTFNLFPTLGVNPGSLNREQGRPRLREGHSSLASLMLSLQGRVMSKTEDEPLCSASILGQDHVLAASLECPKQERMKVFWRAQGRVPAWVPFIDGPKIEESGLRWAPSTLRYKAQLLGGLSGGPGSGDFADIEPGGLGLRMTKPGFAGFELEDNQRNRKGARLESEPHAFRIRDDRGCRYDVVRSNDRYNGDLPVLGEDIAVIVSEWLETHFPQVLVVAVKARYRSQGEEFETINCRIICRGIIVVHETFPRDAFRANSIVAYTARRLQEDQTWLLE